MVQGDRIGGQEGLLDPYPGYSAVGDRRSEAILERRLSSPSLVSAADPLSGRWNDWSVHIHRKEIVDPVVVDHHQILKENEVRSNRETAARTFNYERDILLGYGVG